MLSFEVADATMMDRLVKRGRTSGRVDDNVETIKRRLDTFHSQTKPVIDYYEKQNKVKHINAESGPDHVYSHVRKILNPHGKKINKQFNS